MAVYVYRCPSCHAETELTMSINADQNAVAPKCSTDSTVMKLALQPYGLLINMWTS